VEAELRRLWASTRLHVWAEPTLLVSLPVAELEAAASVVATVSGAFAALVLERDEVSLTVPDSAWRAAPLRLRAARASGPLRVITFDLDLELSVVGYLAPAAARLAEAGVSIVPQCAFLKDHLLVAEEDLDAAVVALESWIAECRATAPA
jgi:hypothetical protein